MAKRAETAWSWKAMVFAPFMVLVPLATYACEGATPDSGRPPHTTAPTDDDVAPAHPAHFQVAKVAVSEAPRAEAHRVKFGAPPATPDG